MNKIKYLISLLILSSLLLTSCLRDVDFSSESAVKQLVVIAELEESIEPGMRLSTTFEVNSAPTIINGDNAMIVITGSDTNFETPTPFRQNGGDSTSYFMVNPIVPEQGVTYNLSVEVPDPNLEPIFGGTTMPYRGSIEGSNDIKLLTRNSDFTELSVSINMGTIPDSLCFYHLIPYLIDNSGAKIFPDVSKLVTGDNGVTLLSHRDGILIDINNLDNTNLLEFQIRTLLPLDVNQLSDKTLYFKLNTVAEEYYLYYQSVSRQFETNQSPFTIPTLSYSQFENGYGIFTAFSSEIFSYPIN